MGDLPKKKPKIALVCSGLGVKALANLPLLEKLAKEGIQIDTMITSCAGSCIAALFAKGYSKEKIVESMKTLYSRFLFQKIDFKNIWNILGIRKKKEGYHPYAPFKSAPYVNALNEIFGGSKIEELKTNFQILATDMMSGQIVNLEQGSLKDALYATNAIYPFLPPIKIQDQWMVSGIFTAANPTFTAVKQSFDLIISVDTSDEFELKATSMTEYVNAFFSRSCINSQQKQLTLSISFHHGPIIFMKAPFKEAIGSFDIDKCDEILAVGEEMVERNFKELVFEMQQLPG